MREDIKKLIPVILGAATTLVLTVGVMFVVRVLEGLYDYRSVLGVLAGRFLFKPIRRALDRI